MLLGRHMLINRITSVVAAIFVVLLVTNTFGFSFHSSNLWPSRRLMHHNNFNHGNWLALTSVGVRQAKSKMIQTMSTTTTTSQSSAPHLPSGERKNILHVIYEQVDRRRTIKSDSGYVLDKLPITQGTLPFDRKSRSDDLIADRPLHQKKHITSRGRPHEGSSSSRGSWAGDYGAEQFQSEPSPTNVSNTTSRNSHRRKRNLAAQLDTVFQLVKMQTNRLRWMTLNSTGHLTAKPDDNSNDTQFVLIKPDVNTTAIYSIRHKKFVCFNNATGDVIAQDCYDPSLCSFDHRIDNNVKDRFVSLCKSKKKCVPGRKARLRLGFDKDGNPINMKRYKPKSSKINNFNFEIVELSMDDIEMHRKFSDLLQAKSCANIWVEVGEKIFKKEIAQNPEFECILTHRLHEEKMAAPVNCTTTTTKEERSPSRPEDMALLAPDLSSTTTMPTPGTTQPSSLAAPSHNQKRSGMSSRGSIRCIKPQRLVRRKVRHRKKKSRTASC